MIVPQKYDNYACYYVWMIKHWTLFQVINNRPTNEKVIKLELDEHNVNQETCC